MMRKIIHLDLDCFFAAVEMRDNPALNGQPVAVGGAPDKRGVVATCNYTARAFGVHSAMATAQALKLCPKLVVVPPSFDKYRDASRQILQIFQRYTPIIEPLSLDEAYLDVTTCDLYHNSATRIAEAIRRDVKRDTKLTISAGIAANKFLAKIASDWRKPDGIFTLPPDAVADFVQQLPVNRIHGVGKVTQRKMTALHLSTCGDLQALPRQALVRHFGHKFGERLYQLCRGIDTRAVEPSRRHKSVSVELTYDNDLADIGDWLQALDALFERLTSRYERLDDSYVITGLYAKVRYHDFKQGTCQSRYNGLTQTSFAALFQQLWGRRQAAARLLGVGVRLADRPAPLQPDLFPDAMQRALRDREI